MPLESVGDVRGSPREQLPRTRQTYQNIWLVLRPTDTALFTPLRGWEVESLWIFTNEVKERRVKVNASVLKLEKLVKARVPDCCLWAMHGFHFLPQKSLGSVYALMRRERQVEGV